VRDLRAIEYGDQIMIDFTIPSLTTEGVVLKSAGTVDLRAGAGGDPFDKNRWAAEAKRIPVKASAPGAVHSQIPASDYVGRTIVVGVRMINHKGRASEWSNLVPLTVTSPLGKPAALSAEATASGVKLTWQGPGPAYRILRSTGAGKPALLGNSDRAEYLDPTAQYGQSYSYIVQAVSGTTESEISQPAVITPLDEFPPAVPSGLTVVSGIGSIELVWDRNTEPDLRGYRVYRATGDGPLERIAEMVDTPSYSDRQIEAGKRYRYAVSSVDQAGNESAKSAAAEATGP
jgi:fibronectin type 3 domain-containing protein